ncbi:MAG: hypothetical protein DWH96_00765 [Planctomycetota bacterium]|nr:MAG: hypothetical protein DWH96_00765 [Planctomycetota bacterium]
MAGAFATTLAGAFATTLAGAFAAGFAAALPAAFFITLATAFAAGFFGGDLAGADFDDFFAAKDSTFSQCAKVRRLL